MILVMSIMWTAPFSFTNEAHENRTNLVDENFMAEDSAKHV